MAASCHLSDLSSSPKPWCWPKKEEPPRHTVPLNSIWLGGCPLCTVAQHGGTLLCPVCPTSMFCLPPWAIAWSNTPSPLRSACSPGLGRCSLHIVRPVYKWIASIPSLRCATSTLGLPKCSSGVTGALPPAVGLPPAPLPALEANLLMAAATLLSSVPCCPFVVPCLPICCTPRRSGGVPRCCLRSPWPVLWWWKCDRASRVSSRRVHRCGSDLSTDPR
mmetsp:Transcript_14492/g.43810  ORF Transcript_14492/g.43810 Transcript_14492/m.43810 type:complete len:219 (+) Transcript_14492:3417-4073(+)